MSRVSPIDTSGQQQRPIHSSREPDAHSVDDEVGPRNASIPDSEQLPTNAHSANALLVREEVVSKREFDAFILELKASRDVWKTSDDALKAELVSLRSTIVFMEAMPAFPLSLAMDCLHSGTQTVSGLWSLASERSKA